MAMRMLRPLKICQALLGLLAVPAATRAQQGPPPPLVLPYVPGPHGVIQIRVDLNDQVTGLFAVDTGAVTSLLNANFTRRLGIKTEMIPRKRSGPDRDLTSSLRMVTLAHLQSGALSMVHIQLREAPGPVLTGISGQEIAGVLGADVLSGYALLIDFEKHRLLLWKGGHLSAAQRAAVGMRDAEIVSLTQPADYHAPAGLRAAPRRWFCQVPIRVNDAPARPFTIDTGAGVTVVPTDLALQQGLLSIRTEQDRIGFEDEPFSVEAAFADSVSVGSFRLRHPVVEYATNESDTDAIAGRDLLSQLQLLLDYPAGKAYFQPRKRRGVALPFAVPGLNIPLITARLKDGKPALFGLEPAYVTSLDGGVVASRHLYSPSALAHGETSIISSLSLGDNALRLEDVPLPISDFTARRAGEIYPEDGFLGADLLDQYALSLDFTRRTVTFISPGYLEGASYLSTIAPRLPLFRTDRGYVVEGQVDGVAARFLVSLTTNRTTLFSGSLVDQLHPVATLTEARQASQSRQLRLHQIQVGNAMWELPAVFDRSSPAVSLSVQEAPPREEPLNWLGTDFLSRFHVVVDYAGSALYLVPDPHCPPPPTEVGIGFVPTLDAGKRMFIDALDIPSPASEAGLQIGDEVVAVNGRIVRQTPLAALTAEVNKPVGTVITLTIRSTGAAKNRALMKNRNIMQKHDVRLKIRKLL